MATNGNEHEFARAFGDALGTFLASKGMSQSDAAKELGLGTIGKARINAYCHDSPRGTRPKPNAEILWLLCSRLGFDFIYKGYKISVEALNGGQSRLAEAPIEQLRITFDGQFNLTDSEPVSLGLARPQGRVEVTLSFNRGIPKRRRTP
jgi:transcriptional regulator with XRE-family HTH domain